MDELPLLDVATADAGFTLTRLCGVPLAMGGPAPAQGIAVLGTAAGRYEGETLACMRARRLRDAVEAVIRATRGLR